MPKGVFGFRGKSAVCHPGRRNYARGLCKACRDARGYKNLSIERKKARGLRQYNLSWEAYNVLLQRQGGVCAICQTPDPRDRRFRFLTVDHNHQTGVVRGLLCSSCNRGLGYFKDNEEVIARALTYIREIKR